MSSSELSRSSLAAPLALLWHKHAATIRERVATLVHAGEVLFGSGAISGSDRGLAESAAHKLSGTLGTFGSPRGSEIAAQIESILCGDGAVDGEGIAAMRLLIADLKVSVEQLAHSYESIVS
jgi:hypothetical protein